MKEIREVLVKIEHLKANNRINVGPQNKYKIIEEIIDEYRVEDEESCLTATLKNIFTQERKLGPKKHDKLIAKATLEKI